MACRTACTIAAHPWRKDIDALMRENVYGVRIERIMKERLAAKPDPLITKIPGHAALRRHRVECLGLQAFPNTRASLSSTALSGAEPPSPGHSAPDAPLPDMSEAEFLALIRREFMKKVRSGEVTAKELHGFLIEHEKTEQLRLGAAGGKPDENRDRFVKGAERALRAV